MYNSAMNSQDDSDITIINPSIINEHNDEYVPIITRLKQANNSSENRQVASSHVQKSAVKHPNSEVKQDYIFVDNNPQEHAKQVEQALKYYVQDLTQETNTQWQCDKQLVVRLMDLVRPVYSHDQMKLIELEEMQKQIGSLHDKRYIEQREKFEQLRAEICQLNKMLLEHKDEQLISTDHADDNSVYNIADKRHSVQDYDQWTEIADDTKKLHEIVQLQQNQINELVNLVSETATVPVSLINPPDDPSTDAKTVMPDPPNPSKTFMNTLLQKIQNLSGGQTEPASTDLAPAVTLDNHSPGTSPSQSLATLIPESFMQVQPANQTEQTKDTQEEIDDMQEPIRDEPHVLPIDIPIVPVAPPRELKKCPVCSHEFLLTTSDEDMYDHIETCLFPPTARAEPTHYECPYCYKKLPGNNESAYLQHLSDCINRDL
ncbi:unnamed protein product [Rotaria socialis]|uniref:Uncharacterized protein n=1 Tax=Rotaria socialis TaxID=392032 RepID=A0A820BEN7_9BILA|nr:unnamed protein product [Rotaria socialis]CAF4191335.1 unnamed protein product [Rotaria socialis]CAF4499048.1 unnamed protein product [Rotaria socialis]CAF4517994.1 unnamed protein product [Rotaria socialis]